MMSEDDRHSDCASLTAVTLSVLLAGSGTYWSAQYTVSKMSRLFFTFYRYNINAEPDPEKRVLRIQNRKPLDEQRGGVLKPPVLCVTVARGHLVQKLATRQNSTEAPRSIGDFSHYLEVRA